ncbi:MAG: ATP-binding protein [Balneolaceae bacterium]|nr:ATP-binding protein [Balneolaceae bacterium]
MGKTDFNKLVLQSSFDQIDRLEPYLKSIRQQVEFSDNQLSRIRLSVNEAVTNAIMHGNKEDPSKKVRITAEFQENTLKVSVKDEGSGFDPSSLPDPLQNKNLLKESGRGIFLIKQYADEVDFSDNGTKLTMQFNLKD